MNDKELLELAAKATGYQVEYINATAGGYFWFPANGQKWNPLTDDGDEARLEAALNLHVSWMPAIEQVWVGKADMEFVEHFGTDKQAARRLAGVRAAAELGKEMMP